MTDMPDFWRREHQFYPQHGGRFTGEEAYFAHTKGASNAILKKSGMKPTDFAVRRVPSAERQIPAAGRARARLHAGTDRSGMALADSGQHLFGRVADRLDRLLSMSAKPGDMIFMCSYGSGAGSDAFIWKVTDRINEVRDKAVHTQ